MREEYTHVTFVLDNSGSMSSIKGDTIAAFNGFLEKQLADPGVMTFSLYTFGYVNFGAEAKNVRIVYEVVGENAIKKLDNESYITSGGTPLLDCMGYAIDRTGSLLLATPESIRPSRVAFVILTDGEENASVKFSKQMIVDKVKHQEDVYKWVFTYLGANQDAIAVGASFGMQATRSMSYDVSKMSSTLSAASALMTRYKTADINDVHAFAVATSYTPAERTDAVDDPKDKKTA